MRHKIHLIPKLFTRVVILSLYFMVVFAQPVAAIAQGYNTQDQGLQTGMVAALSGTSGNNASVERATPDDTDKVVGIVTTVNDSLVSVSSASSKVFVENEGQVEAYVSDINGKVQQGDLLIVSPLKGILMKNNPDGSGIIIGIAVENAVTTTPYNYISDGKTETTNIAKIKINVSHLGSQTASLVTTDSTLGRLGRSLVGKNVGEVRILIAMMIFIIVLIAEGSILYGAISSGVMALGRNPLAQKIIRSELIRVIAIALGVLLVGLGAVYAILWV